MGAYETTQTSWGSEVECLLNVQGPGFCPGHCQTHKPTEAKKKKNVLFHSSGSQKSQVRLLRLQTMSGQELHLFLAFSGHL